MAGMFAGIDSWIIAKFSSFHTDNSACDEIKWVSSSIHHLHCWFSLWVCFTLVYSLQTVKWETDFYIPYNFNYNYCLSQVCHAGRPGRQGPLLVDRNSDRQIREESSEGGLWTIMATDWLFLIFSLGFVSPFRMWSEELLETCPSNPAGRPRWVPLARLHWHWREQWGCGLLCRDSDQQEHYHHSCPLYHIVSVSFGSWSLHSQRWHLFLYYSVDSPVTDLYVRLGQHDRSLFNTEWVKQLLSGREDPNVFQVYEMQVHEDFKPRKDDYSVPPRSWENNIALLRIADVNPTDSINPICLPSPDLHIGYRQLTIAGNSLIAFLLPATFTIFNIHRLGKVQQ